MWMKGRKTDETDQASKVKLGGVVVFAHGSVGEGLVLDLEAVELDVGKSDGAGVVGAIAVDVGDDDILHNGCLWNRLEGRIHPEIGGTGIKLDIELWCDSG
jgi:hypothetical protein